MTREGHRFRFTHGFWVTGHAGAGAVSRFGTRRHTASNTAVFVGFLWVRLLRDNSGGAATILRQYTMTKY